MKSTIAHSLYFNNPYSSSECGFLELNFTSKEDALAVKAAIVKAAKAFLSEQALDDEVQVLTDDTELTRIHEKNYWNKEEADRKIGALGIFLCEKFKLPGMAVYDHSMILHYREVEVTVYAPSDFLSEN